MQSRTRVAENEEKHSKKSSRQIQRHGGVDKDLKGPTWQSLMGLDGMAEGVLEMKVGMLRGAWPSVP